MIHQLNLSLFAVRAVVLLDAVSGSRILSRYFAPTAPQPTSSSSSSSSSLSSAAAAASTLSLAQPSSKDNQHAIRLAFERRMWDKTRRSQGSSSLSSAAPSSLATAASPSSVEILIFEANLVCHRTVANVAFFLLAAPEENEIMLAATMATLVDAINLVLTRSALEKRAVYDSMDVVALAIDQCIDGGIILECDPSTIASRVTKRPPDAADLSSLAADAPVSLSGVLAKAKDQWISSVMSK